MAYEGMIAETVRVHGHGGELIDAYAARPLGGGPLPGVLVVWFVRKDLVKGFALGRVS